MVDHLVLFTVRDDAPDEEVEALISDLRQLGHRIPNALEVSAGENFSDRGGGYTHGLFARFRTLDDLQEYLRHPDHVAVVEKLDALTTGRIVVDYDHEP